MSKVDKQDVLKAILNVKMYAKNLKVMMIWWREMLPQIKRLSLMVVITMK